MADILQSLRHRGRAGIRQSLRYRGIEEMAIFSDLPLERLDLPDKEKADNLQILLQILRHTAEVSSLFLGFHKN
tara:strand:- start:504 stop:725 length:222 start_codon:yes stop_codon:yes gene_type:complete